jgi:hypothetical protein
MKLSPPASSSDLEAARAVARRLHEQRRLSERPAAPPPIVVRRPPAPAAPAARLDVGPGVAPVPHVATPPHHAAPERPAQRPAPVAPPVPEPPPLPATPPAVVAPRHPAAPPPVPAPPALEAAPRPAPERPSRPAPPERPVAPPRPEPRLAVVEPAPPSWDEEQETPEIESADALADLGSGAADEDAPASDDDAIEIEETNTTLEEMVGAAGLPSADEIVGPADLEAGEPAIEEAEAFEPEPAAPAYPPKASPFDENPSLESMSEELFDLPPTPSWNEVVENCLMIAHARGAMLIDHTGQVPASNGFWPEPGPEPIATKLVAMMEKTLKDAPTRSVSAPVGSMHLTAWRVPLAEGMITVAFLGDTPLRAEARTPVDAEILRGAP